MPRSSPASLNAPPFNHFQETMRKDRDLLNLFSLSTALYNASRLVCSATKLCYLMALKYKPEDFLRIYSFHSIALVFLNVPISIYLDTLSRKRGFFVGLGFVFFYDVIFSLLYPIAQSSWKPYGIVALYLAELLYAMGRQMVSYSLNGWVVQQFAPEDKPKLYPAYTHKTQAYTSLFSAISGLIGIYLACKVGYLYGYLASLAGLFATTLCFAYIALQEPKREEEMTNLRQAASAKGYMSTTAALQALKRGGTAKPKRTASLKAYFKTALESFHEVFGRPWSRFALIGSILVALARWITYHFWQPALLGNKIELGPNLPESTVHLLIALHLSMYLGQFLTNQWTRQGKAFSRGYYLRAHLLLFSGAGCAALLALKHSLFYHLSHQKEILLTAFAFAGLQGTVGSLQVLQDNLFVQGIRPGVLAGCYSLAHLCGRLATSFGSQILSTLKLAGSEIFFIPCFVLTLYMINLIFWKRTLQSNKLGIAALSTVEGEKAA